MVRFINKITGGVMYVHENRIDEYLAAGHKLAAPPPAVKKPAAGKKPAKK